MKNTLTLLAFCGSVALVGCTAPNALQTTTNNDGTTARTMTNNPMLRTEIAVQKVSMSVVGDLKNANVNIRNVRFNNKQFQYKIVWVDTTGSEVNPESSIWKPIQLIGREVKTVQSLAPNPSAIDIVVYLKK